jgi:general secretion pathway protein G
MKAVTLLLVLFVCAVSCGRNESARRIAPYTQIAAFKTALDAFEVDCDRLPSTTEGFNALIVRPNDIPEATWHGPYLDSIPKDPWGHEYIYRCPGLHNTNGFDIYSCGPDGKSEGGGNDADDASNWLKQ